MHAGSGGSVRAPRPAPSRARLLAAALLVGPVMAAPAAGQSFDRPAARYGVALEAGFSIRDLGGVRVARDVLTYTGRVSRTPPRGPTLWVEGGAFVRPDLSCTPGLPCNDGGWLARGGVAAVAPADPGDVGPQPGLRAGIGAAVSEDTLLTWLFGLSVRYRLGVPVAPYAEFRWEQIAGINLTMVALGVSLDL